MTGVFLNILTLSVSITPIIVVLLILAPFLNKVYRSGWHYWIWLSIALRLILPFPVVAEFPVFLRLAVGEIPAAVNGGGQGALYPGEGFIKAVSDQASAFDLNVPAILALVYFTGVAAFLIFRLISYIAFRKSIKKWCGKPSGKIIEAALSIGPVYGLDMEKRKIDIQICRKIPGPMVVGFLKPALLLPSQDYDDRKLKMILSHELVHIKRRDTLYKFLLILACSLHWFNPAVHFMARRANQDMEIYCDSKVLQGAGVEDKKMYSHMIVELAAQNSKRCLPVLFNSFGSEKENLEARIKNIFGPALKSNGYVSLITIILFTSIFGSAVQISTAAEAHDQPGGAGSHRTSMMPADTAAHMVNGDMSGDINGKTGAANANGEPYAPEGDADGSPAQGNNALEQAVQEPSEHETNQPSGSAEVVIVDLNQLRKSQETEY